jgi:hypothetical protein
MDDDPWTRGDCSSMTNTVLNVTNPRAVHTSVVKSRQRRARTNATRKTRAPGIRALATGWDGFCFEDARNRRSCDAVAHVLQRSLNVRVADLEFSVAIRTIKCQCRRAARGVLVAVGREPISARNQFAMPSKNGVGRDERRHVSQYGATEPLPEHRETPPLRIVQLQPASRQLSFQRPILLPKKRDHIALLALEPSEQRSEEHL